MAYLLDGVGDYLSAGGAPGAAGPLTFAVWFNPTEITGNHNHWLFGYYSGALFQNRYFALRLDQFLTGIPTRQNVEAEISDITNTYTATTSATYSHNQWQLAVGVWNNASGIAVYLDGGNKGTGTGIASITPLSDASVGQNVNPIPFGTDAYKGAACEVTVWNAAFSDDDVAALWDVRDSWRIRPESIVRYWPVFGDLAQDPNWVFGSDGLFNNGATQTTHAPVRKMRRRRYRPGTLDVATGRLLSRPMVGPMMIG